MHDNETTFFLSRLNIGYFKTVPGIIKLIEVVSKE
jgi:hypothetical protein